MLKAAEETDDCFTYLIFCLTFTYPIMQKYKLLTFCKYNNNKNLRLSKTSILNFFLYFFLKNTLYKSFYYLYNIILE